MKKLRTYFFGSVSTSLASVFLLLVLLMMLLAPVLANKRPLMLTYQGETFFPAFSSQRILQTTSGKKIDLERIDFRSNDLLDDYKVVMPLVIYSPRQNDLDNAHFRSPLGHQEYSGEPLKAGSRHFLGTNETGQDVLSGIIHGSKVSLIVAFSSMLFAALIGLLLGASAGYYGNSGLRISYFQLLMLPVLFVISWFYGAHLPSRFDEAPSVALLVVQMALLLAVLVFVFFKLNRFLVRGWLAQKVTLSVDSAVSRTVEVLTAIPKVVLILAIAAVSEPGLGIIVSVIALTGWTRIARYTRAEVLRLRELDFINALKVQGIKPWQVVWRHLLPNALAPVLVSITFGVASAILIESSLSFLGIGLPVDTVSWGKLLQMSRTRFDAWWLVVFPGLFIFGTIMSLNVLANKFQEMLNPKLRSL